MRVTFYGVRGSIATPGPSTVRYGGNTVCVSVRTLDDTLVMFDIGTGARVLGDELVAAAALPEPINVFVTHALPFESLQRVVDLLAPVLRDGARAGFFFGETGHGPLTLQQYARSCEGRTEPRAGRSVGCE